MTQLEVTNHDYMPGFTGALVHAAPAIPAPAVLVLHGGAGITEHERSRASALAERGYVAFVPDLFGEPFRDRAHGIAVITGLVGDPPRLRGRLTAALEWLRTQPAVDPARVAAIGFCFGGLAALELARSGADLACVVSFHGGLSTKAPAEPGRVRARVLVCTGAADAFAPREHREAFETEMTHAGAAWQLNLYGGAQHGFTEQTTARPGCAYDRHADEDSWRAFLDLFAYR